MTNVAYADFTGGHLTRSATVENRDSGYFALFRSLLSSDWAKDTAKLALWVRLLSQASRVSRQISFNNKLWQLKPGQLVTKVELLCSLLSDSEGNRKSRDQVKRMLDFFEKKGMISRSGDRFGTVITVINYGKYQCDLPAHKSAHKSAHNKPSNGEALKGIAAHKSAHKPAQHEQECIKQECINTPLPPIGVNLEDGLKALDHYNKISGLSCRSAEPFNKLLTATATRKAYTLEDVCLVTQWALSVWKAKGGSLPKPNNICRVTRFDGYLADAEKWRRESVDIDCQAVVDAYNEITSGRMPYAELDRDREREIRAMASKLARKNIDGFRNYFMAFMNNARDFYFGGPDGSGWCANFDTLMKPETLRKVKEGAL